VAFDKVFKALPPYPGFLVLKKACHEFMYWEGIEMRNLGLCVPAVLAVALRHPRRAQLIPFKHPLGCIRALVNFNVMAQYRGHTVESITYMEDYLDTFHTMKDIFLEFRANKGRQVKNDEQQTELRYDRPKTTSAKNYRASDTAPLRPDPRDVESASPVSCAS